MKKGRTTRGTPMTQETSICSHSIWRAGILRAVAAQITLPEILGLVDGTIYKKAFFEHVPPKAGFNFL